MYTIKKKVIEKGESITITAKVSYKEMREYIAKIVNREYFENKANIEHLIDFISNYDLEEKIIENYNEEIVEEFDSRGYFD